MELVIEHKDEKIIFNERDEIWTWNGRSYAKPSSAKAAIDRAQRVDFEKLPALLENYNGINPVTVTSLAEAGYAWIVDADGERSKEPLRCIFADNQTNAALLAEMSKKENEIDRLIKFVTKSLNCTQKWSV